jgi:Domain of unknown function (DUF4468) with TBP-like fold
MKKALLGLFILVSINMFSQNEKFTFLNDGTSDFVVCITPNVKASNLYNKTINWININYKNPAKVIKAKIENEMIRIDGFGSGAFSRTFSSGTKANYDVTYTIEFQFQDGKYRIKYVHTGITVESNQVFFKITDVLNNVKDQNDNGWSNSKEQYENFVQLQIDSLYNYITKPKNDW